MVIKVTVGTKMRGKVIWRSLTMSVICALYIFSVGIFEEEKKKKLPLWFEANKN